jgi:PhnB protein
MVPNGVPDDSGNVRDSETIVPFAKENPMAKSAKSVQPVPEGYHTVTPYLVVKGGMQAIEFYKKALGAGERFRMPTPDGKGVAHAELQVGNSIIMLGDENPGMGATAPPPGGCGVGFYLYLPDVDKAFQRAEKAGGKVKRPLQDQFYGDRTGTFVDPFGHQWTLATHIEDVPPEEMDKRMKAAMAKQGAK